MAVLSQLVDDVVVTTFELDRPRTRVGRQSDNDIRIDEISVSGKHALIEAEENPFLEGAMDFYINDTQSTNGTFVNDNRVNGRTRLNSNDLVRIGWNLFRFVDEDELSLEKTAYILEE